MRVEISFFILLITCLALMESSLSTFVFLSLASFSAVAARKIAGVAGQMRKELAEADLDDELEKVVPEGVETFVPYKGEAKDVIQQLVGALKSGMSYANARSIRELWRNARFMEISAAGFRESKAHNVKEI